MFDDEASILVLRSYVCSNGRTQQEYTKSYGSFTVTPHHAGNVPVQARSPAGSLPGLRQRPSPSAASQGVVHLPSLSPADNSLLLRAIAAHAQQEQETSLTALISPNSSARSGTFTPRDSGAALTCRIPELVGQLQEQRIARPACPPVLLGTGMLEATADQSLTST